MIVIRADGGPEIGYGHLVRTGALASEFIARGYDVTYATTTPGPVLAVCPPEVNTTDLPTRDEPEPFVRWLDENVVDAVIADSYLVDTAYMSHVRQTSPLFTVFSDDARFAFDADILVNGNLYAPSLNYDFVGDPPTTLLGPKYLSLREAVRKQASNERSVQAEPDRALVTMGGSDVRGYTPTAIQAFDGLDLTLDVVLGPGFEAFQETNEAITDTDVDVELHHNPQNFLELLSEASLAVSGCGSTTYELLALGTPFIGVVQAENQTPIADALEERHLAEVLPMDAPAQTLHSRVRRLLTDWEQRATLSSRGRSIIDGRGVKRICDTIVNRIG